MAVGVAGLAVLAGASAAQAAASTPAAPAGTAAATPARWKVVYRTHGGPSQGLDAVTAPARNDAWAGGGTAANKGVFRHWNGKSWSTVTIKGANDFYAVYAQSSSPSNVWFFGNKVVSNAVIPAALVYNGHSWSMPSLPPDFGTSQTAVLGPDNVWGTSGYCSNPGGTCSVLVHWNGHAWSSTTLPDQVQSVASAGGHVWFLALTNLTFPNSGPGSGTQVLYETTGNSIKKVSAPAGRFEDGVGEIAAAPDGQLWLLTAFASKNAATPTRFYHWTGKRWTEAGVPGTVGGQTLILEGSLVFDGKSGVWAGPFAHWTGKGWVNTLPAGTSISGNQFALSGTVAPVPGTSSVWDAGLVARTTAVNSPSDGIITVYGSLP